jgi:hypothetical protein
VFTVRYSRSTYITQIGFVFKRLGTLPFRPIVILHSNLCFISKVVSLHLEFQLKFSMHETLLSSICRCNKFWTILIRQTAHNTVRFERVKRSKKTKVHSNENSMWNFYGLTSIGHICFAFYIKTPRVSCLIFYTLEHLLMTANIPIAHYILVTFFLAPHQVCHCTQETPRLHFSIWWLSLHITTHRGPSSL